MKKLSLLLIILMAFMFVPTQKVFAKTDKIYYAKIETDGVELCQLPDSESGLFEIPKNFFVQVEYLAGDFYKAVYLNKDGYVKKSQVTLMSGTPVHPYYEKNYRLFTPYYLFSLPEELEEGVEISKQTEITFYGIKTGGFGADNNNLWYYSSIGEGENLQFGYIFSQAASSRPNENIPNFNETFPTIDEEALISTPQSQNFVSLSTGTKIMLIVAISVPSLLILYFLIKPSKIMQMSKGKKKPAKKPLKKVKHGDYFEFDESEL